MLYLDVKVLITGLALLVLVLLCARYRRRVAIPLLVAFCIALVWTSYFRYEYSGPNLLIFNTINVYPLLLWTIGLTSVRLVGYELPQRNRFGLLILLYLSSLIVVELIGYHVLNVRLASDYTSLLGLGIIHAPTDMKIFYIFCGPIYFLFLDWLDRRHPH